MTYPIHQIVFTLQVPEGPSSQSVSPVPLPLPPGDSSLKPVITTPLGLSLTQPAAPQLHLKVSMRAYNSFHTLAPRSSEKQGSVQMTDLHRI